MIDPKRILDQFLGGGGGGFGGAGNDGPDDRRSQGGFGQGGGGLMDRAQDFARGNPLLTGGLAGGLAGLLLGRGVGKDVIKYGGMAVIGGLAYKAYSDWQRSKEAGGAGGAPPRRASTPLIPPPAESPFAGPNAPQGEAKFAETLIVAMVAAAKADGQIDAEERGRIYERLEQGGLDGEEVAYLRRELSAPVDIERIARGVVSKEEAVEVYAASLIAIRADTDAERQYLAALAARLGLEAGLVASIERAVAEAAAVPQGV